VTNKYLGIRGTFGALHLDTMGSVTKEKTTEIINHHGSQMPYVNTLITSKKYILFVSVGFGLRQFPICFISLDFFFKPIHLSTNFACFLNFQILNMTSIGPCIVIYFYSNTN